MKTCQQCRDTACNETQDPGSVACEDFTSKAIEEEPTEWQPTLEDYRELEAARQFVVRSNEVLRVRLAGYENAVAELVRWAQGQE